VSFKACFKLGADWHSETAPAPVTETAATEAPAETKPAEEAQKDEVRSIANAYLEYD
jgi:hypothetical protein